MLVRRTLLVVVFVWAWVLVPAVAFAQTQQPGGPPSSVRFQVGPLFLNPILGLTNIGVDDNVFNDPSTANPESDFTMTVVPAVDLWLRFGPTWIYTNAREDLVYYQKFESERSANTSVRFNWTIPFNRLVVVPGLVYLNTQDRPGYEIDTRAQRVESGYTGTLELRVGSNTFLGVRGDHRTTDFDETAAYDGTNLRQELNRTVTTEGFTFRLQATPLTGFVFEVSAEQDRFEFSPDRDTDSTHFNAGLKFDPAALLKGSATFGLRNFRPASIDVPAYQGPTVAVDLSYVPQDSTKLTLLVGRDVQYSYDVNQPYYLQSGMGGSIDQQIFGPVDLVGRIGRQRLDYRDRAGASVPEPDRTDRITSYGGGVGYRMGRDVRIGFNIDKQRRESAVDTRQYDGLRYGFAVTYGL
jgi:Putative beta-barrel porin 2